MAREIINQIQELVKLRTAGQEDIFCLEGVVQDICDWGQYKGRVDFNVITKEEGLKVRKISFSREDNSMPLINGNKVRMYIPTSHKNESRPDVLAFELLDENEKVLYTVVRYNF